MSVIFVSAISIVSSYLINSEFGKLGGTVRTNLSGKKGHILKIGLIN